MDCLFFWGCGGTPSGAAVAWYAALASEDTSAPGAIGHYAGGVPTDVSHQHATLRERNHERTRADIASQALRLFTAEGFDAVTVDDIAAAAGVSRRTFFRYFDTKEDALLPEDSSRLPRLRRALAGRPEHEGPVDAVRAAILDLAEDYDTDGEEFLLRAELVLATPSVHARGLEHQAAWEEAIRHFAATRMGRADTELLPTLLAATCMAALRAAVMTWLHTGGADDLVRLAADALDVVSVGFSGGSGTDRAADG